MRSLLNRLQRLSTAIRNLVQGRSASPAGRPLPSGQLTLEALEDRLVPTSFHPNYIIDNQGTLTTNVHSHSAVDSGIAGYSPAQLRTAYGVNSISFNGVQGTGAGQTIAIVDAYNDPNIASDVDLFDQQFGTSTSGSTLFQQFGAASSFLSVVNQKGQVINPSNTRVPVDTSGGWEMEESLDVEWAHAMAPGAAIDLVVANSTTWSDLFAAVKAAASLPGVSVVSMSFGSGGDYYGDNASDSVFTTPAGHQGVTFLAATGDDSTAGYPALSANVIAVGGTTLKLNANGTIQSETAWSTMSDYHSYFAWGTGGGTSMVEAEPTYQLGVQQTGFRTTPDVAFDADPATGVAVLDSYRTTGSPWMMVGGTSLATPCWAGLMAIGNQGRTLKGLGTFNTTNPQQAQSALYHAPSSVFHDITTGQIDTGYLLAHYGFSPGPAYTAGPGYDEVSGLGTPVASSLIPGLAGYTGDAGALPASTIQLALASSTLSFSTTVGGVKYLDNFVDIGASVTVTATVTAATPSGSTPTGTVSLYATETTTDFAGQTLVGTAQLPTDGSGQVTFTFSTLSFLPTFYELTAFYGGDSHFGTSNNYSSSPNVVDELLVGRNFTSLSLTSSVAAGAVTFTAKVSTLGAPPGVGAPTGLVAFYDGKTLLGLAHLPADGSGQVSFTASSLSAGSHTITAVYEGDNSFQDCKASLKQTVAKTSSPSSAHPSAAGSLLAADAGELGIWGMGDLLRQLLSGKHG
jgi:subtilase family serine protease